MSRLLLTRAGATPSSHVAREAIADPANEPLVSAASMWEIAIKRSLGKLTVPEDLPAQITTGGCGWLPVTQEHAWEVRPLDRLLIAQSLSERIPVITRDTRFAGYGIDVRWT